MEIINATDGYKLGHHRMYPEGTEQVYSNWTPRSNKYFPEATEGSVVFGIQYLIKKYLIDEFNQNFFGLPKEKAIEMFYRRVHNFVGIESVGYRHIEALYDLGYLPIGREVNCYYPTFTFIDDLCDAGGTFLGELKVLKERYPDAKYEIMVCHAVNIKGLVNLCNNFDRVIITNSYCDYGYKPSNNNLTVIDVCG
jgi:hypothetical protein